MVKFSPQASLAQIKNWLASKAHDGVDCPACGQLVKIYHRKISSGAARGLITMHRIYGTEWAHIPSTTDLSRLGGEFARLALWGLVEEEKVRRPDGGRAGFWRITPKGEAFLKNAITVPKYAHVFDSRVLAMDASEVVSIVDALGTKFSYSDLMAGV